MNAEINERLEQSFERRLDLYSLLAAEYEIALAKHGEGSEQVLYSVLAPLRSALMQMFPNLHSVSLSVLGPDRNSVVSKARAYSPDGVDVPDIPEPTPSKGVQS